MPMMGVVDKLNVFLTKPGTREYNEAAHIVANASTVAAAAEASGVYSQVSEEVADEARKVFSKLPPAVDQSILGALRSAFARNASITLDWDEPEDPMDPTTPMRAFVGEPSSTSVTIDLASPAGNAFT